MHTSSDGDSRSKRPYLSENLEQSTEGISGIAYETGLIGSRLRRFPVIVFSRAARPTYYREVGSLEALIKVPSNLFQSERETNKLSSGYST